MNKRLPQILSIIGFFVFAALLPQSKAYATPSVQFNSTSVSVAQNNTFELKVNIQTDTNTVLGSDAVINFASSDLDIVSIANGGFFPEFGSASNASGRIELHGYTSSTNDSRTGSGVFASIVFKAKKSSGSSAVTFTCTGSGNDTNILTTAGQNILNCAQINTAGISYTGTPTNTVTPTATTAPGNTPTHTPTPTQGAGGNTAPSCSSLYTNISTVTGTPQTITLTCSGTDAGGYLNAAEFVFGDGTSQRVDKNAGSPGSISTSHTYTTIGSLGVTCRMRDNDSVWSSIPDSCKKVVTIKQGATPTPTPARSYGDKGITTTIGTSATLKITPTPTRIVVSIISETPEPIVNPIADPTLYPENKGDTTTEESSTNFWWIIGGIIAIILAFLLLRRKGPPKNTDGQVPIANV